MDTKPNCHLKPNELLSNCDCRDVIAFDSRDPIYLNKLYSLIQDSFDANLIAYISRLITQKLKSKCNAEHWFQDGEKCEILKAGSSGWQKGKFKLKINLSLEFIPDEAEEIASPLDDVRQEINQNNS